MVEFYRGEGKRLLANPRGFANAIGKWRGRDWKGVYKYVRYLTLKNIELQFEDGEMITAASEDLEEHVRDNTTSDTYFVPGIESLEVMPEALYNVNVEPDVDGISWICKMRVETQGVSLEDEGPPEPDYDDRW